MERPVETLQCAAKTGMNWISTNAADWREQCEVFWQQRETFELRDVNTDEQMEFVRGFSGKHVLGFVKQGSTVTFILPPDRGRS
jgi:hypothetical protein